MSRSGQSIYSVLIAFCANTLFLVFATVASPQNAHAETLDFEGQSPGGVFGSDSRDDTTRPPAASP